MAELALIFSFLSPFLLAGAFFLMRNFFAAWTTARAQHSFNERIERLRGEIGETEARLNAALQAKQREVDTLRETVLSPLTSRRIALDNRRLLAAEQLWNTVHDLGKLKYASSMMSVVNFDALSEAAVSKPSVRTSFAALFTNIDMSNLPGKDAAKLRPFVSPAMWAYYSAIAAILQFAFAKWKVFEIGVENSSKYMNGATVDKLIVAALPHAADYVKQHGAAGHYFLIEQLEELLLKETQIMLEGKSSDSETVGIVANVMKEVNAVQQAAQEATSKVILS